MSHLDEGTLHALLDGELDLHEVKEIQAHIGSCNACGTRLREVKEFHGETDRLVGLLEVPTAPSRRTGAPVDADPDPALDPSIEPLDDRAVARQPSRLAPRTSGPAAEPPPLLLPENTQHGQFQFMRKMRWAALILVTVGAGYLGNQARQSGTVPFYLGTAPTDSAGGADSAPGAVLSSQEASAPTETLTTNAAPAPEAKVGEVPKREAPRAKPAPARDQAAPESALRSTVEVAGAGGQRSTAADSEEAPAETDSAAENQFALEPSRPDASEDEGLVQSADVRREAAEALEDLDRERRIERADAATAALDARRVQTRAAAPAAPAPRTPEQRAQIYLRIGLDEAAKQLGRPVHVIEGMSPLFMGLAFGRNSPGADATRPVVRVVYQDSQGRLILLDQQRLRPGQSTSSPGNEPHWVAGEIALHLSGEVGSDVLRNWRARVR
jgi:anti-sigma factor RsiW